MRNLEAGPRVRRISAVLGTLAFLALTAVVVFLYSAHPLFEHRAYNIMAMSVFFAIISRLVLNLWAPGYFRRKSGR